MKLTLRKFFALFILLISFSSSGIAAYINPTIIVQPNATGLAINSTQQFTATEVINGSVNQHPPIRWFSTNTHAVIINSKTGLAKGVGAGVSVITAEDRYNGTTGSTSITVLAIGAYYKGGYVYCMGLGNINPNAASIDPTKCTFLPSRSLGGVVYPSDSYNNIGDIAWDKNNGSSTPVGAISYVNGNFNTVLIHKNRFVSHANSAAKVCESLGPSWYLPAIAQLNVIYQNNKHLPSSIQLLPKIYWSSTEGGFDSSNGYDFALAETFEFGTAAWGLKRFNHFYVRCVKNFK